MISGINNISQNREGNRREKESDRGEERIVTSAVSE